MNRTSNKKIQLMAVVGMLAALVFIFTYFGIDIPSPLGKTKIHFGNVMCLLSGLLFGGLPGGLAAGIGSALFDLMDPAWAPEFWITFINKFCMGFVAGIMMQKLPLRNKGLRVSVSALVGALTYNVLYIIKNILSGHLVKGFEWGVAVTETLTVKLPVTLVNSLIAVVCAVLLAVALRPALEKAGLFRENMTE